MNKRQKLVQQQFIDNEEAVIRRLKQVYGQAQKDIEKKTQVLQDDINRLGTLANLATDEEEKAKFLSMQQSKIYQKQYQDAMKKQIGSVLDNMQVEEFKTVSEYLQKCYEDGFVGTMFDLQGQGIPLCFPLDQEAMVRAVQLDSKISNGLYSRLGEDVALLKKKITAQVSRGIATGMSFQQVAKQLSGYTNIGYNNAVRIARTEGHRIQVQSAMDACHKAKDKGADVVKQWDSTLDSRTRESHQAVDGEIRELDKPFSNGLMFPGDPSGGAAEVVNCRCALLQRARWALDNAELETLKERAAYFGLDKADTFEDYKKNYLKAAESTIVREGAKTQFTPAKTIEEAEEFIKQYVDEKQFGALGVSYAGIDIEVANAINNTLSGLCDTFNVGKFGGIIAPAGNTKLGKLIDGATAAYTPMRNSFLVNRKSMKNMKTAKKLFDGEAGTMKNILEHPELYDFDKLSKRVRAVIERAKTSGRATVPSSIEEALTHEFGHMLEKQVRSSSLWETAKARRSNYADRISGYAGESDSEYIAESFASFMKGEDVIDPVLADVFRGLMN